MRIEAINGIGQPIKQTVTRLVVYDDFDNPVAVAVKYGDGIMYVGHIKDKEFEDYLHNLGIHKTLIVDTIKPEEIK